MHRKDSLGGGSHCMASCRSYRATVGFSAVAKRRCQTRGEWRFQHASISILKYSHFGHIMATAWQCLHNMSHYCNFVCFFCAVQTRDAHPLRTSRAGPIDPQFFKICNMLNIPNVSSVSLGRFVHGCWLCVAFNPFRRCQEEEEEDHAKDL